MLNELIGKPNILALMANSALELESACNNYAHILIKESLPEDEVEATKKELNDAFIKVCAYGMDLGFLPSRDAITTVIEEVIDKIGPTEVKDIISEVQKENEEE